MFEKTNNLKKNFTLILFGAVLALIFAPTNWFLLGFLTIPVLFLAVDQAKDYRQTFFNSLFYGFGFFLASNYWISISLIVDAKSHAWLIPFALTLIPLILATCLAISCLLYKIIVKKASIDNIIVKIILFSLAWLISEFLRGQVFSGFPWNLLGYSWLFSIEISQIASLIGVHGLSFFAILTFLSPILFIKLNLNDFKFKNISAFRISELSYLFVIFTAIIGSFLYGNHRLNNASINDKNYRTRIVQANIKQNLKWDNKERYNNLLKHVRLSAKNDLKNIDMVLWSEASIPYIVSNDPEFIKLITPAIPENGVLISGGLRNEKGKYWNSIFIFDKNGIESFYDKHHLVPFGEYVPLEKYLPFVQKITQGAEGFQRGSGPTIINIKDKINISPLICYETIFSKYGINSEKRKVDLFVNLTNDSWFGNSTGPYQHLAMAQMRTIEFNTPMIRVANSGISTYIDPLGRIIEKITLNQQDVIDIDIASSSEKTIYQKILEAIYY